MEIRIKKLHPDAIIPTRKHPGDSGLDLHALLPDRQVHLAPGERQRFRTGIAIELPEPEVVSDGNGNWREGMGYEGQVRPRSGLASQGILASLGTIDNGYRGEIGVTLFNHSFQSFVVRHGDMIAQLVIAPVLYPDVIEVEELTGSERGEAGFGSTGI